MGISRTYLYSLCKEGQLIKASRGLYTLPDYSITEHWNLIQIAKQVPSGAVALISALSFHNLTTQLPHEIWLTILQGTRVLKVDYPPFNITYADREIYSFGITKYSIGENEIQVYSPAKTVADCFKFRSKVGLDVAIEAMRETWRNKKATADEIMNAAKICRVENVIQPYFETIVMSRV